MTPHIYSFVALGVILVTIVMAWRGRFLAAGSMIIGNIVVHALAAFGPAYQVTGAFGVRRVEVVKWDLGLHPDALAAADPWAFVQLLTHMFVHADILHLIGNLIILLAFALPFEERITPRLFTILYLLTGLVGALVQLIPMWGDTTLLIGASGAVFGIIGAFAGAYPNLVVPLPLPLGFFMIFVRMRVIIAAMVFAAQQVIFQALSSYNPGDNTAYFAHLGGLVGGLVLAQVLVRNPMRTTRTGHVQPGSGPGAPGPVRPHWHALDLDAMGRFATTPEARRALDQMRRNEDEPVVFEAWLERFLLTARSPDTGAGVALRKGELVSSRGERFDVRRK